MDVTLGILVVGTLVGIDVTLGILVVGTLVGTLDTGFTEGARDGENSDSPQPDGLKETVSTVVDALTCTRIVVIVFSDAVGMV
jgi:hypothetical protein